MPTNTYTTTGTVHEWTVPSGVETARLKCWGAGGASGSGTSTGSGGTGGYGERDISVSPGETLRIRVGGAGSGSTGGYNGGGNGGTEFENDGGGGGGASDVRRSGDALSDRLAVGGGGGGGGSSNQSTASVGAGGDAGGDSGQDGGTSLGGAGGTQSSGAAEGSGSDGAGSGGDESAAGGGGGGGYWGGEGGGQDTSNDIGGGGGGGSSYGSTTTVGGGNSGDGQVEIQFAESPTLDSIDDTTEDELSLAWTNTDTYDSVRIYRALSSGSSTGDYTLIDTVGGSTTSYTDTGLDDGERYYYRVTGVVDSLETGVSNERDAITVLPAPAAPTISNVTADTADAAWTDNHDNGQTRVDYRATDASSWTAEDTVALGTGSDTLTGLPNGEELEARAVAVTEHTESPSGASTAFTTDLPDEDQPVLLNGVEDEVTVDRESATTNNGDVRYQQRETGETAWDSTATGWAEQVVSYDTLQPTFQGLEDGEGYEYRGRTETEHATGAWTASVAIVTKFPGATSLAASTTTTTAALTWTDNADNEDGIRVEIREQFRDGYGPWEERADLAPNTESYTVDGLLPNTTYEVRVTPYTDDTEASTTSEVTTSDDGVRSDQVPASGWHALVEDGDGVAHSLAIADDVVYRPGLNEDALPVVEVPVPKAPKWADKAAWERQPMRAYHDGRRLPIERVMDIVEEPDRYVIQGRGGVELLETIELDVIEKDAHVVARDDVIPTTSYAAHVDDPVADTSGDVLQQQVDTSDEWTDALASAPNSTDVYAVEGGVLQPRQTAFFVEAENADTTRITSTNIDFGDGTLYSNDAVEEVDDPFQNEWARVAHTFTTEHTIPDGNARMSVRLRMPDVGNHGFRLYIDGEQVDQYPADSMVDQEAEAEWTDAVSPATGDLAAGDHTVAIEFYEESADTGTVHIDCLAFWDDRYPPNFTESVSSNVIDGPDLYPSGLDVQTADVITVEQVVGGRLDTTVNKTNGSQALALSNDSGATWPVSASNSSTVEGSFADGSTSLRARFTLGGYDSDPNTSPAGRTAPHEVDAYDLFADLSDVAQLLNRSFTERKVDVLNSAASPGNSIWTVAWDESIDGIAIEWTLPGQRTATVDPGLVDYSVDTDFSSIHRKAVIYGQGVPESVEFTADHDVWVNLESGARNMEYLQEIGERVTDPDGSAEYVRGQDYELRPNPGEIMTLSTGDMSDGNTYSIEFSRRIRGSYTSEAYDGSYETFVDNDSTVTTTRSADALALSVVRETSESLVTASVTIDKEPGLSLVEAIDTDALPVDDPLEVWSIDDSPQQVTLQLGNRDQVAETIARFERRLSGAERKLG